MRYVEKKHVQFSILYPCNIYVPPQSRSGSDFKLQQEIVVRVLKKADMDNLKEPLCPDPEVGFISLLPSTCITGLM